MGSRGALIVVEGCDRSGKSTQCQMLQERLQAAGHNVQAMKFPDRTTGTGKIIDQYLQQKRELDDRAIHLLFSANRWESFEPMKQALLSGVTLIVDRYAYSGVAFSAAKGLDLNWCKSPDVGLLKPDVVVFLDLDPKEAAQRSDYGEERYEKVEFQTKVRENFWALNDGSWTVNPNNT
ncbi:hypothetical protein HK102_002735 [Quaeritorhiza haematococci]|nr:hypothetical protein HK102_002735 [Quaeritorhiza haematococci]